MKFSQILGEIFFPRQCLACGASIRAGVVCDGCFAGIGMNTGGFDGNFDGGLFIGGACPYENLALKVLIHHLKFRNAREAAEPLAELMARFLALNPPLVSLDCIIPIPLSKQRQRARGYNQATEIAMRLAAKISLPLIAGVLLKTKNPKPQTETQDVEERRRNLTGCFAVAHPEAIAGKNILLIDDVTTSGTTFMEAAAVLKAAGARTIVAVAAAKA